MKNLLPIAAGTLSLALTTAAQAELYKNDGTLIGQGLHTWGEVADSFSSASQGRRGSFEAVKGGEVIHLTPEEYADQERRIREHVVGSYTCDNGKTFTNVTQGDIIDLRAGRKARSLGLGC